MIKNTGLTLIEYPPTQTLEELIEESKKINWRIEYECIFCLFQAELTGHKETPTYFLK